MISKARDDVEREDAGDGEDAFIGCRCDQDTLQTLMKSSKTIENIFKKSTFLKCF